MDAIYKVPANDLIDISTHFKKFRAEFPINGILPDSKEVIEKLINFVGSNNEYAQLEESISISNLSQRDDISVSQFDYPERFRKKSVIEIPKKALRLKTFREILKVKKAGGIGSCFGSSEFSFKRVDKGSCSDDCDLQPFEDVIISIRFYRPFRFYHGCQNSGPIFAEEFLVLGSNLLSELRDKVNCICNNRCLFDMSDDPYQDPPAAKANPGFFFISDTFYNDTRNTLNPDYSSVIREWLNYKKQFKGIEFKTATMEATKFIDLKVRLGFPQVYQHHGNCEHLFTFSSIRLLSPQNNLHSKEYPLLRTVSLTNAILCHICASRMYTFIVRNSNRQFHDPTYLCRVCFESYYYVDGKKVGDFQVYQLNPDEIVDTIPHEDDDDEEEYEEDINK